MCIFFVFLWAWKCEYKEKVAEILKNMYKHTRKIRGNFFAKHFGFLSIFRGLFNKQAIIIRVFQYFLLFFFGVLRHVLHNLCEIKWGRFLQVGCQVRVSGIVCLSDDYCIAGQNPIKFHKEFTILNDTNVTIPAALRIQIRILYPNTHACKRRRTWQKRVRQKQFNYNYNVKFWNW